MGKQLTAAAPAATGITWEEFENKLLVIEPLEVEKGITTVHSKTPGDTDATRANVWVITSKDGSKFETFEDTLVFPKVLQGQLRKVVGKGLIFGRLVKGEKKPGKNPPWTLADPTPADSKAASAFWASQSLSSASDVEDEYEDEYDESDEDSF